MLPRKLYIKYLVIIVLALLVGSGVYLVGKTPQFIDATIVGLVLDLHQKHGIDVQLGEISIQGFLKVQVEGFLLEKKDIGLWVQAKSIKVQLSPIGYWFTGNPVSRLEIDTPEVMANVDFNWDQTNSKPFKIPFSLHELIIRQGRAEIKFNKKVVQIIDFYTNSKISPQIVDIRSLWIQTPEINFVTAGRMHLEDPKNMGLGSDLKLKLTGRLSQIPEIRSLAIPLEADVSLEGRLRYPTTKRGFELEGRINSTGIQIDTVQIASLSSLIFLSQKSVELRQAEVHFAGTSCHLTGMMKFDKQIHFAAEVSTAGASLYELLSDVDVKDSWVDLKLDTKGSIEGQILPEFVLNGHAKGHAVDLIVQNNQSVILQTAYPIQFDTILAVDKHAFHFKQARFDDGKSRFLADCDLFLDDRKGMWLEAQINHLDFASIKNRIGEQTYSGTGKTRVAIEGPYDHLHIQAPAQVSNFEFESLPLGDVIAAFTFENNRIGIKHIRAKQKSLEYEGDLSISMEKPISIVLDTVLSKGLAQDLTRNFLSGPVEGRLLLEGPLEQGHRHELSGSLNIAVLSGPDAMGLDVNLKQGEGFAKLRNRKMDEAEFTLQIKNGKLSSNGSFKESKAKSMLTINLDKEFAFSMSLFMPYGSLHNFMPQVDFLESLNIQAGVHLEATGLLSRPTESHVSLDLSPAVFYLGTMKYLAKERVKASYYHKKLVIEPALFKSVHDDQIKVQGNLSQDNLDLDLQTKGDLWLLTHLDERIEGAYGDFDAHLQIKGPWEHLSYFGKAQIAPGSYLSLRDYPPGLTNLSGEMDFIGARAKLQLKGQADSGNFDLNGFVNFSEKSLDNIQVDLKKMPIYYSSFLTGIADGFLKLEGPFSDPFLFGNIDFSQMLISKELDPSEFKISRSRAKKQAVKLNVSLNAQENVRIESKSLNAELKGSLKLVGNSNAPGLIGEVSVVSGEVYFRNYYYHLVKARANFDNPFRIDPYVDIEANSQILDYDVTVRAQGQLARPKLLFSSKPVLSQPDLFSLIMFGFTNSDSRDNLGVARTAGLEALSAYSGIGDKVLQVLPENTIDELRLGTLYNQAGGVASSVVLGMQVYKGMRLRFQTAMTQDMAGNREKRLELEKYINKRWRWRLLWDSAGVTNYGDAGADLWIRWDY